MPPSLLGWVIEKELYGEFRVRARGVLDHDQLNEFTPETIADLCLRRVLTLQREVRRSSLLRQREALASVSRSAIEATLVGLYSLHTQDQVWVDRVRKAGRRYIQKSLQPWTPEGIDVEAFTLALGESLTDVRGMPDLSQLADRVDDLVRFGGDPVGRMLYDEFFAPLSNASVHTGLMSLGRYYSMGSRRLRRRPIGVVPRRGLVRTTDACAALLAAAIAAKKGRQYGWFLAYGREQLQKANRPVPIMYLTFGMSALPWLIRHLPTLTRAVARLSPVVRSPAFRGASEEERLRQVLEVLAHAGLPMDIIGALQQARLPNGE
jgi:hypothetical protein